MSYNSQNKQTGESPRSNRRYLTNMYIKDVKESISEGYPTSPNFLTGTRTSVLESGIGSGGTNSMQTFWNSTT